MPIPPTGRVIGVDWGEVRIGLAVSDETQLLAAPLEILVRRRGKRFPMPRFLELVAELAPVGIVVGLPLTPEGGEREATAAARDLAGVLARRTGLPVELWDERLSTARVLGIMRETDTGTRRGRDRLDARAAAVMLQSWLEATRPPRRPGPVETEVR